MSLPRSVVPVDRGIAHLPVIFRAMISARDSTEVVRDVCDLLCVCYGGSVSAGLSVSATLSAGGSDLPAGSLHAPVIVSGSVYGRLVVAPAPGEPSIDDDGLVAAVAEVLGPAIERLREEQARDSDAQRLAMAQRIAGLGSYDWEIASDTNRWSDELYRIYGTQPQSFNPSYETFISFVHPDDRERVMGVHRVAYETGEPYQMEERIIRPDGEIRTLISNGEVILGADGTPVRMTGICMDVTEQRRSEAASEQAKRRLVEMTQRRRQALEINDNIVQGLVAALTAVEAGDVSGGTETVERTLQSARALMSDLLDQDGAPAPGELVRDHPVRSHMTSVPAGIDDRPPAARGRAPRRVVIADDSDDLRMLLRMLLTRSEDFDVVAEAADGATAIDAVAAEHPDVVLLDLAMPTMDGLQAMPEIRASSPETKIVVLSGFDGSRMKEAALDGGADAYIEKGSSLSGIAETLLDICETLKPAAAG